MRLSCATTVNCPMAGGIFFSHGLGRLLPAAFEAASVRYRRVSLVAARSRDGLLSEPTAVARHLCDGASEFGPLYRSSDPSGGGGIKRRSRRPALAGSVSCYQRVLRSSPSLGRKAMAGSVGFVGLGNMGRPMALNLVKAGFELVVHDIQSARLEPLVAAGATLETSPEAV